MQIRKHLPPKMLAKVLLHFQAIIDARPIQLPCILLLLFDACTPPTLTWRLPRSTPAPLAS